MRIVSDNFGPSVFDGFVHSIRIFPFFQTINVFNPVVQAIALSSGATATVSFSIFGVVLNIFSMVVLTLRAQTVLENERK